MEQTVKKSRYALWITALLAVFVVVSLVGTKVFYGFVVPQIEVVKQFSLPIILGFAFLAGLASFFSPCGFAAFPAYIAYFLSSHRHSAENPEADPLARYGAGASPYPHALKIGIAASLGIFSFYLVFGALMASLGLALAAFATWLKLAIVPLFFILGLWLLLDKSFGTKPLDGLAGFVSERARGGKHFVNMYLFGVVYGVVASTCFLPVIIALALVPILAGGLVEGVAAFLLFALGASLMLILFTLFIARGKNLILQNIGLYGARLKKAAGIVIILTGVYILGFYVLFGM